MAKTTAKKPDLTSGGLLREREERVQAEQREREAAAKKEEAHDTHAAPDLSVEDVVEADTVLTRSGLPDMRLKSNRDAFLFDAAKTVGGRPDNRLLQNRPDLQQYRSKNAKSKANLIFTDDGHVKPEAADRIDTADSDA